MTTDFPSASAVLSTQLDTGPLSWVMTEIRESLGRSLNELRQVPATHGTADGALELSAPPPDASSLNAAADNPVATIPSHDPVTALQLAKTFLHQAHGALQMVDINGVTIITETVEALLEHVQAGQAAGLTTFTSEHVERIQSAYEALIEYLEDLLVGAVHQPVKLFPYYEALLEIRGAQRIHPADLFFPDLSIRPQFVPVAVLVDPEPGQGADTPPYPPLRKRFETALLPFLKSSDSDIELANAAIMQEVLGEIERLQQNQQARTFWWVMQGFADGVAHKQIPKELFVKQLFARINLELRRLSQGSSVTSERLLRDALFFIAGIQNPSALNLEIRSVYQLDGAVPTDFHLRRYGRVDPEALKAAKEHLMRAKNMWDRLAAGDPSPAQEFEQEMRRLSIAGNKLNAPSLVTLLRELSGIAHQATQIKSGDPIGCEIATSLLFVENSLAQINRLPENFADHADAMTAHFLAFMSGDRTSAPAPWLHDIFRDAQQKILVKALAGEMLSSLRHVEKLLDEYFSAPAQRELLVQIDHVMHQIQGALAIQELPEATAVIVHTRAALQQFNPPASAEEPDADGTARQPSHQDFERIAQNIGALSFYIEATQHQSDLFDAPEVSAALGVSVASGTKNIHLNFDAQLGVFRVNIFERRTAAPTHPKERLVQSAAAGLMTAVPTLTISEESVAGVGKGTENNQHNQVPETNKLHESDSAIRLAAPAFLEGLPSLSFLDLPIIEDASLQRQREELAELAEPLIVEPHDVTLRSDFIERLEQSEYLGGDGKFNDNHDNERAAVKNSAAIPMLDKQAFSAVPPSFSDINSETLLAQPLDFLPELLLLEPKPEPETEEAPDKNIDNDTVTKKIADAKLVADGKALAEANAAAEADAEILGIFLEEATEVLQAIRETVPKARLAPDDIENVVVLRRAFHTLKGSSRMIGMTAFGDAGWSIEEVLNLWLSEARAGTPDLYALLDHAVIFLGDWIAEVCADGASHRTAEGLIEYAQQVREGKAFLVVESAVDSQNTFDVDALYADLPLLTVLDVVTEDNILSDAELVQFSGCSIDTELSALEATVHPSLQVPSFVQSGIDSDYLMMPGTVSGASADILSFPSLSEARHDDSIKNIGDLAISLPLYNIYLSETDHLVRLLSQDFSEWHHEPERSVAVQAIHAAHSLSGSSATVGFKPLQNLAHALEMLLQRMALHPTPVREPEFACLDDAVARIKWMLLQFAQSEMPYYEPALVGALDSLRHGQEPHIEDLSLAEMETLGALSLPSFRPALRDSIDEILAASAIEASPGYVDEPIFASGKKSRTEAITESLSGPLSEAINESLSASLNGPTTAPTTDPVSAFTLEGTSGSTADPLNDSLSDPLNEPLNEPLNFPVVVPIVDATISVPNEILAGQNSASQNAMPPMASQRPPDFICEPGQVTQTPVIARRTVIAAPTPELIARREDFDPARALRDDIDMDLLPVFLEEGRDILPQIESALRSWQTTTMDSAALGPSGPAVAIPVEASQAILRHLHTIKGSARMAGAMVLGQHLHDMESHIAATLFSASPTTHVIDELLAHYDHGVQMFEDLAPQQQAYLTPALTIHNVLGSASGIDGSHGMSGSNDTAEASDLHLSTAPVVPTSTTGSAPAPWLTAAPRSIATAQVRVNAEVLDRLVNQAGEVSIARSRLESGVSTLQQSLVELTENVDRLRSQLREIEIQAETQITSRMTLAGEREFDPLEFDRFTRLQELTRMMAESVNDVSSLQKILTRTVESASVDLVTQGRLTRDLQQDLMHVRMVQFASVAERLYRLTRQVSKEVDKRINLDIVGSTVEIDRSVLEKMVGPFEHLLRNAIVHGIESRDMRRAAGKNDIGELKIEIRQNGNEVLIGLSDDGQGLNLGQIRDKARSVGLLGHDQQISDIEATDLIFRPGFSTVTDVTKLAGRGIGMDVVRSEAAALGGRVAVSTKLGKGTQFTIHLPLTLAVTQVVIFSAGDHTYAFPSALIEQVQQLKAAFLTSAYNDGGVSWQDQRVPLHYLSALLGEHQVTPVTQQYSPVIILRSGNDRVAVHVDAIIGNREVVVKNVGPQLSRLIGIVGATVLGSGEIVLILNPVPLALKLGQQLRAVATSTALLKANPSSLPSSDSAIPTAEVAGVAGAIGAIAEIVTSDNQPVPVQGLRTQKIIMVVDDSLTVRRVTQRLLAREGYQVVLAKDGIDALQQLQAVTPDVMLVDIEMPHMDGFDLTRNVRNDDRTRHVPIIMITSRTAPKHRTYAMELGVNEYLGKPFQEDTLLSTIKSFMPDHVTI
ncbi:Hpt domain-containing protein [Glaciimonas immobilis]|nr:Hpt domain-containing protein [Glaciimonas immobilis]